MLKRVFRTLKSIIALLVLGFLTKLLIAKIVGETPETRLSVVLANSLLLVFVVAGWVDFFEVALPKMQELIKKTLAKKSSES